MPGTRSTEAEVEQRIQAVYALLLRRESRRNICQFVSGKWGVDDRTAERYIAAARSLMREELQSDRDEARAEHLALRKDLFNRLYKEEKWGAAFQIAQDEAKLLGLYFDLKDHIKAAVSAGYAVYEPNDPTIAKMDVTEIEIGLAHPDATIAPDSPAKRPRKRRRRNKKNPDRPAA